MKSKKEIGLVHILVVLLLATLSLRVKAQIDRGYSDESIVSALSYAIPIAIAFLLLAYFRNRININDLSGKVSDLYIKSSTKKVRIIEIYVVILGVFYAAGGISQIKGDIFANFSPRECIILLITCLLTAVFEEIIFRSLVQRMIFKKILDKNSDVLNKGVDDEEVSKSINKIIRNTILISSLIFALFHFLNLFADPNLVIGTMAQVGYTFCLGMAFGTIYFVTKSIYRPIFIHFMFNFLGQVIIIAFMKQSFGGTGDIPVAAAILQVVFTLPLVFMSLGLISKLYKKKKIIS